MYVTCCDALGFAKFKEFEKVFWVDSKIFLSWIRTPPREFRPFISVRVAEIQESVGVEDFCYARSKSKSADALTRGIAPDQLKDWMSGPSFLQLPESDWPKFENESLEPPKEVTKKEMKSTKK